MLLLGQNLSNSSYVLIWDKRGAERERIICTDPYDPGQRAIGGGLFGAGTGAAIRGIAGGGGGAATGPLIGGALGAVGGVATTPSPGYYGDGYGGYGSYGTRYYGSGYNGYGS